MSELATIKDSIERAIAEGKSAASDRSFGLLDQHETMTGVVKALLGQYPPDARRRQHLPLVRLSTMAPIAAAAHEALLKLMQSPDFQAAIDSAAHQCLDHVEPQLRSRWRAGARDVATFAARDAILAGVDRALVELARSRPIKASAKTPPLPRSNETTNAHRSAYWSAPAGQSGRRLSSPQKKTISALICPAPPAFEPAQETYWLLVLVQQMGWPLPDCLRDLFPLTIRERPFSVDQVRYLIRRDSAWTSLHCAKAGVRIEGLTNAEAASILVKHAARGTSPVDDPTFGRWPQPDADVLALWEEKKKAYFDELLSKDVLSPEDQAYTAALILAQCAWPMPALVTRLFPMDWVTRKLPTRLGAAALAGSLSFDLLDAVMANAQVRELKRSDVKAFVQRQDKRERQELDLAFAPSARPEHLRGFFGGQGQGPFELRDRLEALMVDVVNGADLQRGYRLTLEAFAMAKAVTVGQRAATGFASATNPLPARTPSNLVRQETRQIEQTSKRLEDQQRTSAVADDRQARLIAAARSPIPNRHKIDSADVEDVPDVDETVDDLAPETDGKAPGVKKLSAASVDSYGTTTANVAVDDKLFTRAAVLTEVGDGHRRPEDTGNKRDGIADADESARSARYDQLRSAILKACSYGIPEPSPALISKFPHVSAIDVVRALEPIRLVPLSSALIALGLDPHVKPDDLSNENDRADWQSIIDEAHAIAVYAPMLDSSTWKFILARSNPRPSWEEYINIHSELFHISGYNIHRRIFAGTDANCDYFSGSKIFKSSTDNQTIFEFYILMELIILKENYKITTIDFLKMYSPISDHIKKDFSHEEIIDYLNDQIKIKLAVFENRDAPSLDLTIFE